MRVSVPDLLRQLEATRLEVRGLVDHVNDEAFHWRPAKDAWSIGECLDHLTRAADLFCPAIARAVLEGRENRNFSAGPFALGAVERLFVRMAEPPPRRKFKAPSQTMPTSEIRAVETTRAFLQRHDDLCSIFEAADGLDIGGIRLRFPPRPIFRFRCAAVMAIVVAHERRHVWQAVQVAKHPLLRRQEHA